MIPLGLCVHCRRLGEGVRYAGTAFSGYSLGAGIRFERTAPGTPPQIGGYDREEGTHAAAAMTRSFLQQPTFLWGESFVAAAYVSKRAPQSPIAEVTPYKNIYRKNADMSYLRVNLQVAVRGVDMQRNAANAN